MKQKSTFLKVFMTLMLLLGVSSVWAEDFAPVNTVLWGENFAHFGTKTPSTAGAGTGTTIYGSATISYSQSSTSTKGYNEKLAGGTAPELLLAKNNTTWTISGISTGKAQVMTLTFKSNKSAFTVSSNSTAYLVSGSATSWTFTLKDEETAPSTFNITIKNTSSGDNARIDDIVLKVTTAGSDGPTKTLTSLAISGNPSKTTYEIGEAFNPKGLVVTGTYSDGSTDATLAPKATWNITPATFSSTTQNSVSATATVSGVSSTAYSVTGLTVKKHEAMPGTYTINLNNDLYGISKGNNETEQSATKNYITIVSGCTSSATSKTYYDATHIRYYDNSYLKLAVPDGYKITRVQFNEPSSGKTWSGGINVDYGTYTNDTKSWSGSASSLKFSFTNQNRAASITVTYEAIKTLTSIAVKTAPATTSYAEGESFDPTGLVITATYDDNSAEDIVYNNNTKDKFSFNPALDVELATTNTSVEITFGGKTCNQAITVEQIELVSVEVSGTLTKSEYVEGSDFDFAGLVATAKYSNNNERDVTEAATWTIDPAAITFGLTSVKVCATFNDVSGYKDYDITVTEAPKVITEWKDLFCKSGDVPMNVKANDVDWNGTTVFEVSVNVTNGNSTSAYLMDDEIRMYKGYTMTLTAPSGKVFTKIETTKGGKSFTSEAIAANVGKGSVEGSAYTWIGTTNELVITCSNIVSIKEMAFTLYDENATQDVTITDAGYATAYIPFASTVEGATAYYVTVNKEDVILNKIEGTIPAETGVVLEGEEGTATFTLSTNTPKSVEGNLLVGTTKAKGETFDKSGYTYYILSTGENGIGFYWDKTYENDKTYEEGKAANCAQYKAVLAVPTNSSTTPSFFTFDDATAINGISSVKASGVRYNLNGQAVGEDYKGIVIVNGKKMFNK